MFQSGKETSQSFFIFGYQVPERPEINCGMDHVKGIEFKSLNDVNILILKMNTYFFHECGGVQAFTYAIFNFIIKKEFSMHDFTFEMVIEN